MRFAYLILNWSIKAASTGRLPWYYLTDFYTGIASVKIDGVAYPDVNLYTPWAMNVVAKTWAGLSPGNHTIEIRPTGTTSGLDSYINVIGFEVDLAPLRGAGSYSGENLDWYHGVGWDGANGMAWTFTGGEAVRFNFVGDSISYAYNAGPLDGIMTITIDGVNKGSFDHYLPVEVETPGTPHVFSNLGPGPHTIVLQLWQAGTRMNVTGMTVP